MAERTDQELLRDFAENGSEAAFGELTRRYVDFVYSVAARMVDQRWAEDITQAVFVALARDAAKVLAKVRSGAALAGWLHVTTRNLAARQTRDELRRARREREAVMQTMDPADDSRAWEEIAPELDAALAQLRTEDRDVLLLRFFAGKSAREIAALIAVKEEAAQKRIARALHRLRAALGTGGARFSGKTLAAALAAHAIQPAPQAFAASVGQAALSTAAASGTAVGGGAAALASFAMNKAQLTVLAALVAGLSVPIIQQRSSLQRLRESAVDRAVNGVVENATENRPYRLPFVESARGANELEEIARLKQMAGHLREQIAAKRSTKTPEPLQVIPAGPVLLSKDKPVRLEDLLYAGNATPEAALQSVLAFQREGNVDGAFSLMLAPPSQLSALNQKLADPDAREVLAQEMQATVYGAVVSESVKAHEDGTLSEPETKVNWPESSPHGIEIKVAEKEVLDDRRVQFRLSIHYGAEEKSQTFTLGGTPRGWKLIL